VAHGALPTGTVTFLFTDIEGSTRLVQELGSAYADVLHEHRRLLRGAFERHAGVEVDTQGDAFFFAFGRATDAVKAAIDGQAALTGGTVRVRMGLHTGDAVAGEEGYVGVDVHRAARICAAAHGGQILLSASSAQLVDVDLHDLGEHRLKDLFAPMRLYQVGHDDFPPLRTLNFTNLPIQSTQLVGRDRETGEVVSLLHQHRLVTLVGPGGTGKTRLALQAAADASDEFTDGVFWVPLAELRDPRLVVSAIAQAIGITGGLEGKLTSKRTLFLVDNFEQVMPAATELARLLENADSVKLLITSREPLRIAAEWAYPVPSLPHGDAVALFTARARAVDPSFDSDAAVDEICRQLDGVPLAIELAASRTTVLSTEQILERLTHRLGLLTAAVRDAPLRHQTLRATIDWSHDLLTPQERELFARLAVFSGGWTLDAAETVCGAELDALEGLVAKSLVRYADRRFGMLEMIREYAAERLAALDIAADLADQHARYFLAFAESSEPDVRRGHQSAWAQRTNEDRNIARALDHLVETGRADLELRLVAAAWQYWFITGRWDECGRRLHHAIDMTHEVSRERALVLRAAGWLAGRQHDFVYARECCEQARQVAQTIGDAELIGFTLRTLAVLETWDPNGDPLRKVSLEEEAARSAEAIGDKNAIAALLNNTSIDARWQGDFAVALERSQKSVAMLRELDDRHALCVCLPHLADAERLLGAFDRAKMHLAEALLMCRDLGFREKLVEVINNLAVVCASSGDYGWAAALLGIVERENSFGWSPESKETGDEYEEARKAVYEQLGDAEVERAVAAGRAMSLDVVQDYLKAEGQTIAQPVDVDSALSLVVGLDRIRLGVFAAVGAYMRFDTAVREALVEARQTMVMALEHPGRKRNAHLIWAAPGSGKSYFVQQVADSMGRTRFAQVNLANSDEESLRTFLDSLDVSGTTRTLCFVDECDSPATGFSPYALLLPVMDDATAAAAPIVFVFAGSSGSSVDGMREVMAERPKGADLLSRIPVENVHSIAPLDIGDRILVALSQLRSAAAEAGRRIAAVERMALFYVSVDNRLGSPRQLRELCVRAVERLLPGEERLRYDHLFSPGNPENKAFWMQWQSRHGSLVNQFVDLDDG
jgi:predicted ATPase/predicted AAA+ superfamily ATPase